MATSEAKEIKKQETLVRFSIISYKTRLRVVEIDGTSRCPFVPGQNELKNFNKMTRFPVFGHHVPVLEQCFLFKNIIFLF